MELTPITCNHCGASLEVPPNARFVTCRYCNSQLEIKRTESTITTEVLHRIDQNTTSMAQDLQAIRRESEIERLDREWAARQGQLMTRDKQGNAARPSATTGIVMAVTVAGFGILWTIIAFAMSAGAHSFGAPGPFQFISCIFPLFGILFVAGAIAMGIKTALAANRYNDEERQYLARREELLRHPSPETPPQNQPT